MPQPESLNECLNATYRAESRRVLATLIRLLGDFDLAEEALHDAFRAALEQWPRDGIPANPRAWLVSEGRFKAIDGIRRRTRFSPLEVLGEPSEVPAGDASLWADAESVEDDRLRLIFTCCHPALAADAQVALTLREVCDRLGGDRGTLHRAGRDRSVTRHCAEPGGGDARGSGGGTRHRGGYS